MMPRCVPVSGLRIPVIECGEPLVDLRDHEALRAAGMICLRLSLVDRLVTAQTLLPARVKLLVCQGYRATDPAHAAGAAVDLAFHPTESRHWSYGDPYWAHKTGAAVARFGPCSAHHPGRA